MRSPRRNKQKIYYSLYQKDATVDKWGNTVGGYTDPKELYISLSAVSGETSNETFGKDVDYDRTMVTTIMSCPIDTYSHLWIDRNTDEPYNYVVKKVALSKNQKRYAIKEITNEN